MSWTSLVLRHLRGSAARWAALAAVVAVTRALVLVWPRWLDRTATSEMHRDLGSASAPLVDPSAVVTWLPVSWVTARPRPRRRRPCGGPPSTP